LLNIIRSLITERLNAYKKERDELIKISKLPLIVHMMDVIGKSEEFKRGAIEALTWALEQGLIPNAKTFTALAIEGLKKELGSAQEPELETWWEQRGLVSYGVGRTTWSEWSRIPVEEVERYKQWAAKTPNRVQIRMVRQVSRTCLEVIFPTEPTPLNSNEKELETLLREAWSVIRWHCFGQCRTEGVEGMITPAEIDAKIHVKLTGRMSDQERAGQ